MKRTHPLFAKATLPLLAMALCIYAHTPAHSAAEAILSVEQKQKIRALSGYSAPDIFQELKKPDFLADEALMDMSIQDNLSNKKIDAINFSMNVLRSPRITAIKGKRIDRTDDFYVAQKIFKKFPNEAIRTLEKEYHSGNALVKGNIISMLGTLDNKKASDQILRNALDDTSFSEEVSDEMEEGDPMRVCDIAYNQLVLRYQVMNVLRTIGPIYKVDVRDYHIAVLKSKLTNIQ